MAQPAIAQKSERIHAFDKLEDIIEKYQRVTRWFGFDIFRDGYKLNGALFCSFFIVICYYCNCVYWADVAIKDGDMYELLKSMCLIFAGPQVRFSRDKSQIFIFLVGTYKADKRNLRLKTVHRKGESCTQILSRQVTHFPTCSFYLDAWLPA